MLIILIQISMKFVSKGPFANKEALVRVMVWCQAIDKPVLESMMILFTEGYMCHPALVS